MRFGWSVSVSDSKSKKSGGERKVEPVVFMSSSSRYFRDLLRENGASFSDYNDRPFTEQTATKADQKLQEELIR